MGDDSAARFRASLDKLLYYDKDRPASPVTVGGVLSTTATTVTAQTVTIAHSRDARPHDRRDYIRRVSSFRPANWFAKPDGMRPDQCAKRGWVCIEPDTLQCESCAARLIFKVPSNVGIKDALQLAKKTALRLDKNHETSCGWRGAECPSSVTRFPRVTTDQLLTEFKKRRNELLQLEMLPECIGVEGTTVGANSVANSVANSPMSDVRFTQPAIARRVARLVAEANTPGETPISTSNPHRLRSATTLALCGWTVGTKAATSETRIDINSDITSPSPKRNKKLEKVTGSILRCELCDAKCATWNFIDTKQAAYGRLNATGSTQNPNKPLSHKKAKPKTSVTALMGAMGNAFGASVFAADAGNTLVPSISPGTSATTPVLRNLGLSIAGGSTPSKGIDGGGGGFSVNNSPPAFGAGALRDSPFGAPGRRTTPGGSNLSASPSAASPIAAPKRKHTAFETQPVPVTPVMGRGAVVARGTQASVCTGTPAVRPLSSAPTQAPTTASFVETPRSFYPLRLHRAHCPWSVAPCVGDGGVAVGQPGWQSVLDAVAPFRAADAVEAGTTATDEPVGLDKNPGGASDPSAASKEKTNKKPPGRLEEYTSMSGRAAVASYLAGGA